jgi:hypothetical protein
MKQTGLHNIQEYENYYPFSFFSYERRFCFILYYCIAGKMYWHFFSV